MAGVYDRAMRSIGVRRCAFLLVLIAIAACNATSTTTIGKSDAAAAYVAAATAANDAHNATLVKYAGYPTQAQNRELGIQLADEARSFANALRAIEFPAEVEADLKLLLQKASDVEVGYRIAAAATTPEDSKLAWESAARAELAVSRAANTVRADLGLPSVPISTPASSTPTAGTQGSAGLITFGTAFDPKTLYITKAATRFRTTYHEICFSASLTAAAGASSLKMVMGRLTGGSETQVWSQIIEISDPKTDVLADCTDLAQAAGQRAATYAVRYLRGGTILAQGSFSLVK